MNDKELYHHGIRGQKWGKRNGPPYPLDAIAKARAYRKRVKRIPNMSDKDIDKRTKRLEKERRLRELERDTMPAGQRVVEDILKSSGSKVAKTLVTAGMLYGITKALGSKFPEIVNTMNKLIKK